MSDSVKVLQAENPPGFDVDFEALATFEAGLNLRDLSRSVIPGRVMDYGEISTVFAIEGGGPSLAGLAFKRLSIFDQRDELAPYLETYRRYCSLLEDGAGLTLVPHGFASLLRDDGLPVFYIIQQELPAESIAHRALTALPREGQVALFRAVLQQLAKVWAYNAQQTDTLIAVDGQLSNWALADASPASSSLLYLDTSTPFVRIAGREQLNTELFLRSAPSFLRWLLRWLFVDDVVNRYYDARLVVIDAIANMFKEQLPDLVPEFVREANVFFAGAASALNVTEITEKEVEAYYREDAFIWRVYLGARRLDRFLTNALPGREYRYLLPGRIKR